MRTCAARAVASPRRARTLGLRAVRQQRQQVRILAAPASGEAERQRIARELHDRVGQDLTALSFNLSIVGTLLPRDTEDSIWHACATRCLVSRPPRTSQYHGRLRPWC